MTELSLDTALARMQTSRLRPSETPRDDTQNPLRWLLAQRASLAALQTLYTGEHAADYELLDAQIRDREKTWTPTAHVTAVTPPQEISRDEPHYCQMCGIAGRLVVLGKRSCVVCAAVVRNGGVPG